jgi:hypothetical protein
LFKETLFEVFKNLDELEQEEYLTGMYKIVPTKNELKNILK